MREGGPRERVREGGGVRGRDRETVRGRVRVREWVREGQGRHPSPRIQDGENYADRERRWSIRHGGHRGLADRWRVNHVEDNSPTSNEEGWAEVSHRRKRITTVNRGISESNNHQWQDRRGTWRNKADVTSFYFSRFPDGINENDLWQTFQRWGTVWEVFIPKAKNKVGWKGS